MNGFTAWQRANIQAAIGYLRERMSQGATDPRTATVYEGLLEVIEPARRTARLQREAAAAAKAAVTVQAARERRALSERRTGGDRRVIDLGSPTGLERRAARAAIRPGTPRRQLMEQAA